MNIYFKNIHVINPENDTDDILNLWLKDGIIAHLDKSDAQLDDNTEQVEASHLTCAPGFLDMHVHFREPGFEYKEDIISGSQAAENGGFTAAVLMPNTEPAIDNVQTVAYLNNKSKDLLTDLFLSAAITQGRLGKQLAPMFELNEYGVLFFTDDGNAVMNSQTMKRAFEYAGTKDLLIAQHCEDHNLTEDFTANEGEMSEKLGLKGYPSVAEEIIVARDIMLAEYSGNRRYHAQHISTKGSVELIRNAKKRGLNVTCEVAPHHFVLTDQVLADYDTRHKMNPPLRTAEDIEALIEGLADGTVDAIASDHAPHALHEKHVEFDVAPHGIIGLETEVALSLNYLVHTGRLSLKKMIEKFTTAPRQILRLPQVLIKVGQAANLTILDTETTWNVDKNIFKSKSKNSPFHEFQLKGKPAYAVNNGKLHKCKL